MLGLRLPWCRVPWNAAKVGFLTLVSRKTINVPILNPTPSPKLSTPKAKPLQEQLRSPRSKVLQPTCDPDNPNRNPKAYHLVAEFISPQKCTVYTIQFIVGNIIPKSVKCIHSATRPVSPQVPLHRVVVVLDSGYFRYNILYLGRRGSP